MECIQFREIGQIREEQSRSICDSVLRAATGKKSWLFVSWCFEPNLFQGQRSKTHKRLKRTLFKETKQDKTCKFSRKTSFSSYVQQYNRKQLNQLILCPFDASINLSCIRLMLE